MNRALKAPEFYQIFREYDAPLIEAGFKRKAKNKYAHPEEVMITVVLNKWGWIDDFGWGFLLRFEDVKDIDKTLHGQPRKMLDIHNGTLESRGYIPLEELKHLYQAYEKTHPKFYRYIENGWIYFYDAENLRYMLKSVMPTVGTFAGDIVAEFRKLYP